MSASVQVLIIKFSTVCENSKPINKIQLYFQQNSHPSIIWTHLLIDRLLVAGFSLWDLHNITNQLKILWFSSKGEIAVIGMAYCITNENIMVIIIYQLRRSAGWWGMQPSSLCCSSPQSNLVHDIWTKYPLWMGVHRLGFVWAHSIIPAIRPQGWRGWDGRAMATLAWRAADQQGHGLSSCYPLKGQLSPSIARWGLVGKISSRTW